MMTCCINFIKFNDKPLATDMIVKFRTLKLIYLCEPWHDLSYRRNHLNLILTSILVTWHKSSKELLYNLHAWYTTCTTLSETKNCTRDLENRSWPPIWMICVFLILHTYRNLWKIQKLWGVSYHENDRHGKVFYKLWLHGDCIQHDGFQELRHCLRQVDIWYDWWTQKKSIMDL